MSKKLYTGLVPLLALVAFAMAPAAAQAKQCTTSSAVVGPCPHFELGGKLATAAKQKTLSWGNLTLTSSAGTIACSNAILAREWNPAIVKPATDGASGEDETLAFGSGECVDETCPGVGFVQPRGLPWTSELIEGPGAGEVQDESSNVKVVIGCENPLEKGTGAEYSPNGGKILGELEFETTSEHKQTPTALPNGSSGCNKPSELEFAGTSGSLSAAGGAVIGTTSGSLKICGYEKQGLAKTPIT